MAAGAAQILWEGGTNRLMPIDMVKLRPIGLRRGPLLPHAGSPFDAEDAVQDTMVRAWQSLNRFEGPRVDQHVALSHRHQRVSRRAGVRARAGRARFEEGPVCTVDDDWRRGRGRTGWSPSPTRDALPSDVNPHELTVLRQSIRLAFVAALQHLPPRQRAALHPERSASAGRPPRSPTRSRRRCRRSTARCSVRGRRWPRARSRSTALRRTRCRTRRPSCSIATWTPSTPTTSTRWCRCCATMRRCRCRPTRSGCRGPTPSASGCWGAAPAAAGRACCA